VNLKAAFRNTVLVAVFFFTVAGFFQNCTQAVTNGGTETQYSGNGEGYGGKARYENSAGTCPNCSVNPPGGVSAIEREGRKFSVVRRDCAEMPPQALADGQVEYLPHSKNTAVFEGRLYQVPGSVPPPSAGLTQDVHRFCRVNRLNAQGSGEVVDAYILRASDGSFRARANVASYLAFNVRPALLDQTVAATHPGAESYSGTGLPAGEFFQLDITLPGVTPLNFNLSGVYRSELVTCYSY
jgi:hypothetical protein